MTLGALAIARLRDTGANVTVETASGFIARTKAAKFALPVSGPKFGYCRVYDRSYNVGGLDPSYPDAFLDAGISLPLSGPSFPQPVALARTSGPVGPFYAYSASRPFETGLYTLTGNGGSQVGPFSVSTNFPANFNVTNWDSITAVDRTRPLTLNWTGTGFSRVTILFATNARTGSRQRLVNLNCENIPATMGSYTIPPEALAYLLSGNVLLTVHAINQATFTAPLTAGGQIDLGLFNADLGIEKTIPVSSALTR